VRTGLLIAGVAVAVIGAGVLLASLTFATGPTYSQFDPVTVPSIPGHTYYEQQLVGVNESSASVTLTWAASNKLVVSVYPAVHCPHNTGVCPSGTAVATWWADSGRFSATGSLAFPLFLNLSNANSTATSFSATFVETYTANALTNPTWNLFLPLIGAVVLCVIGGVAIFLGLFLPTGVYAGENPPPLDPEDDELGGSVPPAIDADLDGDDEEIPPTGGPE
jgi:hypothetical protein